MEKKLSFIENKTGRFHKLKIRHTNS